ncbi:hypothetical protein PsorP6_019200 [Peronosclerospora sorghi]|nr:hypothetical protein PsorP6_019200 [Peronosclerospora sorghi]
MPDEQTIPRIRMSAISDLNEFSGKEGDGDQARNWISRLKSAFMRDQASDHEKFLILGDLLKGPARNWHHQLSRSTRSSWKSLVEEFEVQYCGSGQSASRQYYYTKQRSDESPIEYLHRLNVAGLRAKWPIRDGSPTTLREHVQHFLDTLANRKLADQLALLRLYTATDLEETLRVYARNRWYQPTAAVGTSRFRQKFGDDRELSPARKPKAVRAINVTYGSEE